MSRRYIEAYLPAALWAAFLLYLGGRAAVGPVLRLPVGADKVAHALLYGVLGGLALFGWRRAPHHAWIWPVLAAIAVGGLDEWHQKGVPGRSAELLDWVADSAGITIAFLGLRSWRRKERADER